MTAQIFYSSIFIAANPNCPYVAQNLQPHHARKLLFESILTLKLLNQLDVLALRALGGSALLNGFLPGVVLVFTLRQGYWSATQIS